MRVAILSDRIPPEHAGGAEKAAWSLAVGLQQVGHDVHVIAATAGAPFREKREGIPTYHLHANYPMRFQAWLSLYNPQTVGPLRALLKELQPAIVHAQNVHHDLSYASLPLARRLNIPVVFTAHDLMPFAYGKYSLSKEQQIGHPKSYRLTPLQNVSQMRLRYNPFRNVTIRIILRRYAQIRICVSQAQRQALEDNLLPSFRVVNYGIDPDSLATTQEAVEALRERYGLMQRRVILFGGRLSRAKGSDQLLKALGKVVASVPDATVLALSARKWQPTEDSGLRLVYDNHVREGGWLQAADLAAAYHLADVVTVPSVYLETFGLINLEAMAASKPVVCTSFGGPPEVVVDNQTGYVVNPFDTELFAERLTRLLLDPDLRRRMGEAGRQRLLNLFSLERQVAQTMALYEEAVSSVKS